jgi:hypothetical protein
LKRRSLQYRAAPVSSISHPEVDRIRRLQRRLFAALMLLASSCASAELPLGSSDLLRCRDSSELTVYYQGQTATVLAGGHSYALRRKPSSVGKRFASHKATLIIDGHFAAFVADDLDNLGGCRVVP